MTEQQYNDKKQLLEREIEITKARLSDLSEDLQQLKEDYETAKKIADAKANN